VEKGEGRRVRAQTWDGDRYIQRTHLGYDFHANDATRGTKRVPIVPLVILRHLLDASKAIVNQYALYACSSETQPAQFVIGALSAVLLHVLPRSVTRKVVQLDEIPPRGGVSQGERRVFEGRALRLGCEALKS